MKRRTFLQTTLALAPYGAGAVGPFTHQPTDNAVVFNAGVGGNNTVDLLARIDADCLAQHPELTILMIGTNDVNSRKHVPIGAYGQNLRQLCTKLKAARSEVVLMTILPVYEPYLMTRHDPNFYKPEGHPARTKQLNQLIRDTATSFGLPCLDMHRVFATVGNIGLDRSSLLKNEANSGKTDGVHPTPDGYRLMAVTVYTFLTQRQLLRNRIVCFGDSITKGDADDQTYPAYLQRLIAG
ncbi:GDSL-type esterase/lipase family protein [Fibrella sp. WM1]|uniref:SGNH/GDSL hydrolase family protein n=1 Tax=Fibrella musci TaxID=3242485 RepID=UPI0035229C63